MTLALLAASAGSALAQRVDDPVTSDEWLGDEPDVTAPGNLPYDWEDDPSASYPADDNGLGPARRDGPGLVLAVNWVNTACVAAVACDLAVGPFLQRLGQGSYIVPGVGQFHAWYGAWHDLNGDGWLDHALQADRAHVNVREGGCEAGEGTDLAGVGRLRTDDPNGLGQPQNANTGVTVRCTNREFEPAPVTVIAAYLTPGGYDDDVNRWDNGIPPATPPPGPGSPDFFFQGQADEGEPTGEYFAPGSNFDFVMLDNSLLETTVLEAIADPQFVTDGARSHEPKDASLVEVDLYTSVDPAVEGLFQENLVGPLAALGCDVSQPELGCPKTSSEVEEAVFDALEAPSFLVGPAFGAYYVPLEVEDHGVDYAAERHLYLNVLLRPSTSASLVASHQTDIPGVAPFGTGAFDPTGGGEGRAFGQMQLYAWFGAWHDANADGFIGEPEAAPECPDAYDCGATQDPNFYASATSNGEFKEDCGANGAGAGSKVAGSMLATVASSTDSWGAGVYVLTDRKNAANANNDPYVDDGRVPFNPYDDLALDAADDGEVDALRTTGEIQVTLVCRSLTGIGLMVSYERLVFLEGNRAFDVITTGTHTGDFTSLGVPQGETVTDTDVYPAFDL